MIGQMSMITVCLFLGLCFTTVCLVLLFLSYSFAVSIVNSFFPSGNKGGNYMLFLALSVPGKVPWCSASVLVLLAGFLNSAAL